MDSGFDTLTSAPSAIALALAEEIGRGMELLALLSDRAYTAKSETSGSVGEHFRHNLNFVEAVLSGAVLGRIDYAKRERDIRIETDRVYAAERFAEAAARLMLSTSSDAAKEVSVVSEVNGALVHRSSVGRELEFAHSHAVHHHALIAEKLRAMGVEIDAMFGVAPSTKRYWDVQQTSVC